jgi:hypothetical protein
MASLQRNQQLLNNTLSALQPGDVFIVPNTTFWLLGGIRVENIESVVIQIDGTLSFSDDRSTWPTDASGHVLECLELRSFRNVTFTSSGVALHPTVCPLFPPRVLSWCR